MTLFIDLLLWFTLLSVAIMAGLYFAFSVFVMKSLDAIDHPAGMQAMQSINRVIVRTLFLPLFFGSTLSAVALIVIAFIDRAVVGANPLLAGCAIYVAGMFVVTVVGNVPLNNRLEATDAQGDQALAVWKDYLARWTRWNSIRTIACTVSLALLVLAVAERV